jgi:5-methylthioadenosine/S-adenosylhomocysteine deaminase
MHIHETAGEIEQCLAQSGKRPLALLEELGLVTPLLQAVHMTHLEDNEMQLLRKRRCSVIHCPESNLKLASGICPVASLSSKGVNVALGTDGVASNNDLDMFGEMRSAALLAKIHNQNATALAAHEVLEMATINGARALGIDANTGSLEIGKAADITAINLNRIETLPVYDPVSQLVYCCSREQVEHVWVAGRQLLRNRQLTTLDETELLATANAWQEKIASTA